MLGKLLKYEVKATARTVLPLLGGVLLFALLNRIFFMLFRGSMSGISTYLDLAKGIVITLMVTMYILLIVATFTVIFVVMLQRYYKNLYGDEGYLMFTLPVKPWQHVVSKLLVSVMWVLAGFVVVVGSLYILGVTNTFWVHAGSGFESVFHEMAAGFGMDVIPFWTLFGIYTLLALFAQVLHVYCAISVGQLLGKHRIIGAFLGYFVIYVLFQIISGVGMMLLFAANGFMLSGELPQSFTVQFWIFALLLCLLYGVSCFVGTDQLMKRKLDLE